MSRPRGLGAAVAIVVWLALFAISGWSGFGIGLGLVAILVGVIAAVRGRLVGGAQVDVRARPSRVMTVTTNRRLPGR